MEFKCKYNIGKKLDDKKESSEEVSDASKPKFKDFIAEKVERENKPITDCRCN